jgi:cytoskeletal protein CcmA (bactofilin family)
VWRKATEAKPSSQRLGMPAPAQVPVRTGPVEAPPAVAGQAAPQLSAPGPVMARPVTKFVTARDSSGESRLGSGLKVRGEISGNEDLYIDGETHGRITLAEGRLTIGPNGRIQADIEAREIVINGVAQGNVKAGESVHLGPSSRVQGSVLTKRIGIDDGALLSGKVETNSAVAGRGSAAVAQVADAASLRPVFARGQDELSDL